MSGVRGRRQEARPAQPVCGNVRRAVGGWRIFDKGVRFFSPWFTNAGTAWPGTSSTFRALFCHWWPTAGKQACTATLSATTKWRCALAYRLLRLASVSSALAVEAHDSRARARWRWQCASRCL